MSVFPLLNFNLIIYFEEIKEGLCDHVAVCMSMFPFQQLSACVFFTEGTRLPNCCLARTVSFCSSIPPLKCNITLHSKFVGRGVFCEVSVV
jgi:hypothetical protein